VKSLTSLSFTTTPLRSGPEQLPNPLLQPSLKLRTPPGETSRKFSLKKREVTPWFQFKKNLGVKAKLTETSARSKEVFSGKIDIVTLANWKLRYIFGSVHSYHVIPYPQQS